MLTITSGGRSVNLKKTYWLRNTLVFYANSAQCTTLIASLAEVRSREANPLFASSACMVDDGKTVIATFTPSTCFIERVIPRGNAFAHHIAVSLEGHFNPLR